MKRVFLGMLTPSSNTILEPVTTRMLAGLPGMPGRGQFLKCAKPEMATPKAAPAESQNAPLST